MQNKRLGYLGLLAIIALFSGCSTAPEQPSSQPLAPSQLIKQAEDSSAKGSFVSAAQNYLQLAQQSSANEQQVHLLAAATILVRGQHIDYANTVMAQIKPAMLSPRDQFQYRLTRARIALFEFQPDMALEQLRMPDINIPATEIQTWHTLRAEAFAMSGNHLESVREHIALENQLYSYDDIHRNHQQIWQALNQLSATAMLTLRTDPAPDVLSGWLELGYLYQQSLNRPDHLHSQLQTWAANYPSHPAADQFIDELLTYQDIQLDRPNQIALLLPLSGSFASPAKAIRDGFLAAYYSRNNRRYSPEIRIYDTSDNVLIGLEVYQQAIDNGADMIIGPLHKPLLEAVAAQGEFPVKTLALNYLSEETLIADNFFQYGLLPEDEARQVAERAWLDGHNKALVLAPEGEWGERMLNTFQKHWQQLDGNTVEVQRYNPALHDFAAPVINLLNIDESRRRKNELQQLTGLTLKFEPRRRQDVDFIYVAAFPSQARQIRPQLKFYYAADLPVYSTSHVFSGKTDSTLDRDMNGITFSDMPWVFTDGKGHQPDWKLFTDTWQGNALPFKRLYAMGIDAYRLISQLNNLHNSRQSHVNAETGTLYLDENNRIHRQLLWARFRSGKPRLIDATPALQNKPS